jgi:hypothetical protein
MKIKLSTVSTKYETDNKSYVKCILRTKLNGGKEGKQLPPFYGLATLHKDDKFDYNTGCRIALAKAERNAYKKIGKILAEEYESLANFINDLSNFIFKAKVMVKHNTEYIEKLTKN